MILGTVISKNKLIIRLTHERWMHIITAHPEIDPTDQVKILSCIEKPDMILQGDTGELLAVRRSSRKRFLVVVYKEEEVSGFIITAYVTSDIRWLLKRKIIWSKES